MARGRVAVAIELSVSERLELDELARRARIVLLAADGLENKTIAAELGAVPDTVGVWRRRFAERRLEGLHDEPRPGTPHGSATTPSTIHRI
jgi:transposase